MNGCTLVEVSERFSIDMNLMSSQISAPQSAITGNGGGGVVLFGGAQGIVLISLILEILIVLGVGLGGRRT